MNRIPFEVSAYLKATDIWRTVLRNIEALGASRVCLWSGWYDPHDVARQTYHSWYSDLIDYAHDIGLEVTIKLVTTMHWEWMEFLERYADRVNRWIVGNELRIAPSKESPEEEMVGLAWKLKGIREDFEDLELISAPLAGLNSLSWVWYKEAVRAGVFDLVNWVGWNIYPSGPPTPAYTALFENSNPYINEFNCPLSCLPQWLTWFEDNHLSVFPWFIASTTGNPDADRYAIWDSSGEEEKPAAVVLREHFALEEKMPESEVVMSVGNRNPLRLGGIPILVTGVPTEDVTVPTWDVWLDNKPAPIMPYGGELHDVEKGVIGPYEPQMLMPNWLQKWDIVDLKVRVTTRGKVIAEKIVPLEIAWPWETKDMTPPEPPTPSDEPDVPEPSEIVPITDMHLLFEQLDRLEAKLDALGKRRVSAIEHRGYSDEDWNKDWAEETGRW